MPASTLAICLSLEEAIHPACFAQLEAFGVQAAIPLSQDDLRAIAVIPLFTLGPAKHQHRLPTGGYEHDIFGPCTLTIELSVPRFSAEPIVIAGVYSLLGQNLARIREAFSWNQGDSLNARLPFHHLTHLIPAGTSLGFSSERGEDIATIAYRCDAGILRSAWPT